MQSDNPSGLRGDVRRTQDVADDRGGFGAAAPGFFGLIDIVSRDADEFLSHDFSRGMKRQVLLSEMDAIGVAGECDIGAVVDDETAVTGPGQAASAAGELE